MIYAPGLTPLSVFEKLSTIQMVEVWIPMLDGRNLSAAAPHTKL